MHKTDVSMPEIWHQCQICSLRVRTSKAKGQGSWLHIKMTPCSRAFVHCPFHKLSQSNCSWADPMRTQARGQLQELRRVTVTDMFADNTGSVLPLLRQLVRRVAQGDTVPDIVQVGWMVACFAGGCAVAMSLGTRGDGRLTEYTASSDWAELFWESVLKWRSLARCSAPQQARQEEMR
eukprot:1143078-Pelagomonas_calceolata.AAC.4